MAVVGVVLIVAGVVLLLRAVASVRGDLVARLVHVQHGPTGAVQRARGSGGPSLLRTAHLRSFEEEVSDLSEQVRRNDNR